VASAEFVALPGEDKREIAMERGRRAWRGYFPVGGEGGGAVDGLADAIPVAGSGCRPIRC
jgi:hypothetical protein